MAQETAALNSPANISKSAAVLGIDPGFTGALAVIDPTRRRILELHDMPLMAPIKSAFTKAEKRRAVDLPKLASIIQSAILVHGVAVSVVEDVGAMPGQGTVSMFRFGFYSGAIHGILAALNIRIVLQKPAVWKARMNLSRDKQLSIALAKKLFPHDSHYFQLKGHDGRAEACLLALSLIGGGHEKGKYEQEQSI